MPQADDVNVLGKRVARLGAERIEGQSGDKTQPGILNVKGASVGQSKT